MPPASAVRFTYLAVPSGFLTWTWPLSLTAWFLCENLQLKRWSGWRDVTIVVYFCQGSHIRTSEKSLCSMVQSVKHVEGVQNEKVWWCWIFKRKRNVKLLTALNHSGRKKRHLIQLLPCSYSCHSQWPPYVHETKLYIVCPNEQIQSTLFPGK